MAFFEKIGKKLSDAGQGVSQQAKNLSEISRLNGVISESEKKAEELYRTIGAAYYEAHKGEIAGEQGDLIAELDGLMSEIRRAEEKILAIKGIGHCPECGAEVTAEAAFCSACGARLPEPPAPPEEEFSLPEERLCPNCKTPAAPDNLFCNHCGTRLDAPAAEPKNEEEIG